MFTSCEEIVFILPSFRAGGAERVALNYIKYLRSKYCGKLFVVVFNPTGSLASEFKNVESLNIIVIEGSIFSKPNLELIGIRPSIVISFIRTTNLFSMRLAKLCDAEVICREANPFAIKRMGIKPIILQFIVLFFYWIYKPKLIFNSCGTLNSFRRLIPNTKKKIIYNPLFTKIELENKFLSHQAGVNKKKNKVKRIVVVGRDVLQKNLNLAIRVAQHLEVVAPNCYDFCFYVGDSPMRSENLELVKHTKNIKVCKFSTTAEIFENADLLLSTSSFEGFGNVFLEAMYYDTKIVALNGKGSIKELILDAHTGVCVLCADPEVIGNEVIKECKNLDGDRHFLQKQLLEKCTLENFHEDLWSETWS